MAGPTADEKALIHSYEPVLFFAPGERLFPSDVKRYVERCALYKATLPADPTWQEPPELAADTIVVTTSEAVAGTSFLGDPTFLKEPGTEEFFLSLFGWRESDAPSAPDAYANVEAIVQAYEHGILKDSRFWYHAEFFTTDRLKALFDIARSDTGLDFATLLKPRTEGAAPVFKNPALICYYLFFPAHEEGLPDCNSVPEAQLFANYAGDWGCVAVLIDRPTATRPYEPRFIGLTGRNIGLVKTPKDKTEVRVGMRVLLWQAVKVEGGAHPRVLVAKGTHALYLDGEAVGPVTPFTPDDLTRNACGVSPPPVFAPLIPAWTAGEFFEGLGRIVLKMVAGAVLGHRLFPWAGGIAGGLGLLAGAIWGIAEAVPPSPPTPVSPPAPPSPGPITDTVPTPGATGARVIHPPGAVPAGIDANTAVAWPSQGRTAGGRSYDIYVDRQATVLWADNAKDVGFRGRWGVRVHDDDQRRSGMFFPRFWQMFLVALVKSNPPGAGLVQVPIDRNEGIAIGNATGNGGLAAAYDGDFEKTLDKSPTGVSPLGVFIGKRFPTKRLFSGIGIRLSSDFGFRGDLGVQRTCTVFGRSDLDPATPTDGTQLLTFTVTDTKGLDKTFVSGFDITTKYDRVWVTLDNPAGDRISVFTQVVWYETI